MKYKYIFVVFCMILIVGIFNSCDTRGDDDPIATITLEAIPDSMFMDNAATGCEIVATLVDPDGDPIPDKEICFDIEYDINIEDAFLIPDKCVDTDDSGIAATWVWDQIELPLTIPFTAEVTASWGDVDESIEIRILPVNP